MSHSKVIENKEIVQAIVIADSYNDNFQPFTGTQPLALLPVANVPLIEYTLEILNRNGVEEVILFCSKLTAQVKRYVHERQADRCTWSVGMAITIISSETCRCVGEALRDLDARNMIRGNVLLLGVDSVTNANLGALLAEHKRLTKLDRGAVMTVVYKQVHRRLRTGNELMIAMDPSTRRLLYHQRLMQHAKEHTFDVPLEVFLANRDVSVCHGLHDPSIAVCSAAALPLFADNFDFLTRDDFVRGVLINEEILNSRIYVARLARQEYALRVNNWQTYQLANLDIMNRWAYPLVPDMAISEYRQQYMRYRNNVYRHRNARLSRACDLDGDLMIGEECDIQEGTAIRQSTIGRGCRVGRNCRIRNSFLLDGATVGEECVLEYCVIGPGVKLGPYSHIRGGSVLGEGVELPAKTIVTGEQLQATPAADEWSGSSRRVAERAYTVPYENDSDAGDSDSDADDTPVHHNQPLPLGELCIDYPPSIYEPSDAEDELCPAQDVLQEDVIFLSEVLESLTRGFTERTNAEYLILEINSSRYAYNMALSEVNYFVVKAILQIFEKQDGAARNTVATFRPLFDYFEVVLRNYIRDHSAMSDCLLAIGEMCPESALIREKVSQLIYYLYERELVEEDAIVEWYDGLEDEHIRSKLQKLVTWLKEASDEGEDDDEDDDND